MTFIADTATAAASDDLAATPAAELPQLPQDGVPITAVVISPHLDDAVFSCGQWLASRPGALVVTVFAGEPDDPTGLTDWDAQCGFASAGEAMQARRQEDRTALRHVGARPCWLGFRDSQYLAPSSAEQIAAALQPLLVEALARPSCTHVLLPLGLFHSDHALVHAAAVQAVGALGWNECAYWAYEEALYRPMPGRVQARLAALQAQGVRATPVLDPPTAFAAYKARAVAAYRSQARAFGPGGLADTGLPERCWRLDAAIQ